MKFLGSVFRVRVLSSGGGRPPVPRCPSIVSSKRNCFFLAASDTPRLPNIQISFSEISPSGLLLLKRRFRIREGLAALQTAVRCCPKGNMSHDASLMGPVRTSNRQVMRSLLRPCQGSEPWSTATLRALRPRNGPSSVWCFHGVFLCDT